MKFFENQRMKHIVIVLPNGLFFFFLGQNSKVLKMFIISCADRAIDYFINNLFDTVILGALPETK